MVATPKTPQPDKIPASILALANPSPKAFIDEFYSRRNSYETHEQCWVSVEETFQIYFGRNRYSTFEAFKKALYRQAKK